MQAGCDVMFSPGAWCFPRPAPFVKSCCTPGFECRRDRASLFGHSCQPVKAAALNYTFEGALGGGCDAAKVEPGGQCGGGGGQCARHGTCDTAGPWLGFCCPDGFTCQPRGGRDFRVWQCAADASDQPPAAGDRELLQYPPRPLPRDACTCRLDADGARVPMPCPSPWEAAAAAGRAPPPPVAVGRGGRFVDAATGADVVMRGVNWFGWNVGQYNFDGLWVR